MEYNLIRNNSASMALFMSTMPSKTESEREKYMQLHSLRGLKLAAWRIRFGGWPTWKIGGRNHAKDMYPIIEKMDIKSVCDVGCGYGDFCNWMIRKCDKVVGVDIGSIAAGSIIDNPKITFIDAEAKNIPLPDNCVEYVTSFDCLEHCLEEDVDDILQEFSRIASVGFIFSICYKQARQKSTKGNCLHMTVRSEKWWIKKISRFGEVKKVEKHLFCKLKKRSTEASC